MIDRTYTVDDVDAMIRRVMMQCERCEQEIGEKEENDERNEQLDVLE